MSFVKNIAPIHFITSEQASTTIPDQVAGVYEGGISWVQLRLKKASHNEFLSLALEVVSFCHAHKMTVIINDSVDIAKESKADGIHLGRNDISPTEARMILGEQAIIGGTANSFVDILRLADHGVDYIGLGPFRYTVTKELLSPILGTEGYLQLVQKCKQADIHIPIIAIGGIVAEDIASLMKQGIQGIAVSGAIIWNGEIAPNAREFSSVWTKRYRN